MRKLIFLILLLSVTATATLNEVDKSQVFSKSLLVNGGFENGKAKWTASAGTFAVTGSSPMIGLYHATWDAAASGNTLTTTAVTIPAGMYGRNAVASCLFTVASGTGTHEIEAYDGSNILAQTVITSSTTPTRTSVNFVMPSSGSISLRVEAKADEPSVAIDDCYLGPAEGFNLSMVAPREVYSAFVADGSSTTTVSRETIDWISGNCTNGSTGVYVCTFVSGIFTATPNCQATVDKSGAGAITARINTVSTTSITVETFTTTVAGDTDFVLECAKSGADVAQPAYTADQLAQSWSGYHDDTCSWARTNTAVGAPTDDASCALVQRTNSNFGTVSTSGSVSPAITFTPKRAGRYWVRAAFPVSTSASAFLNARLTDGTNTIDHQTDVSHSASTITDFALAGIVVASSTSPVTLSIQTAASSGSITIQESASAANTGSSIEWSIFAIDNAFPQPAIQNSVVSPSSGVEVVARLYVTNSGTPTISRQSGSWVSSLTDNGPGLVQVNIASGTFSAAPTCVCMAEEDPATNRFCQVNDLAATPSATRIDINTTDDGGTDRDVNFHLICMGPK